MLFRSVVTFRTVTKDNMDLNSWWSIEAEFSLIDYLEILGYAMLIFSFMKLLVCDGCFHIEMCYVKCHLEEL